MDSSRKLILIALLSGLVAFSLFSDSFAPPAEEGEEGASAEGAENAETDSAEDDSAQATSASEEERLARLEGQQLVTIETDDFVAQLSNLNTGIVSFELKDEKFLNEEGDRYQMVSTNREEFYAFRTELPGIPMPEDATWEAEQVDARTVRFTWRGNGFTVVRKMEAGQGPYQIWSTTRIHNGSDAAATFRLTHHTYHYVAREAEEAGMIGRPSTAAAFGVCDHAEDVERVTTKELVEDARGYGPNILFTAIADSYFTNALVSPTETAERCVLEAGRRGGSLANDDWQGSLLDTELRFGRGELAAGDSTIIKAFSYLGPSDRGALRAAGHGLPQVVDLGWFSWIANGFSDLLGFIHGLLGNWGFAIILLTILVKLLFFPVTMRSFRAMGRMRQLKPQIDAINEKYADDREKKGAAMMELYRKEGVNPVSGCLPSLLQMPVWFALYRSLSTNIELYHAPFIGYWTDLSAPDPFYVLPVLVAVLMHVQQRLTPNTMDSQQAKIMMWVMPLMIGGFMLFLPAGLCLYMVTNSTLTMIQQRAIYAKLDAEQAAKDALAPAEEAADDDDNDQDAGPSLESTSASATRRTLGSQKKKRQRRG